MINEGRGGPKLLEIDAFLALPLDQSKFRNLIFIKKIKKSITGFTNESDLFPFYCRSKNTLLIAIALKEALRNCGNKILTDETSLPWPVRKGEHFEYLFSLPRIRGKQHRATVKIFWLCKKSPKVLCNDLWFRPFLKCLWIVTCPGTKAYDQATLLLLVNKTKLENILCLLIWFRSTACSLHRLGWCI